MTLKTNTAATASAAGSVVLTVAASATLGGESVVPCTRTVFVLPLGNGNTLYLSTQRCL